MTHGEAQRLAAELLDAPLHLAPPARKLVHQLVQPLVQRLHVLAEFLLARLGQLLELLRRQRLLAGLHRREDEALRRAQQGHADLRRFAAETAQGLVLALFGLVLHRFDARTVVVALEAAAMAGASSPTSAACRRAAGRRVPPAPQPDRDGWLKLLT
jgi:hypothetical protein